MLRITLKNCEWPGDEAIEISTATEVILMHTHSIQLNRYHIRILMYLATLACALWNLSVIVEFCGECAKSLPRLASQNRQ